MNRRQKIFIAVLLIVFGGLLISGSISDSANYRSVLAGGHWYYVPQPNLSQLSKDIRNYIGIILIGIAGYIILGKKK
jgi:hypothetical protein